MRIRIIPALVAALAAAALLGYAVAGDVVPTPGGIYVEAVVGSPRYLNPLLAAPGSVDDDICALVYSGLTRVLPDGDVRPDLALDWRVSADGREYAFQLRPTARWHDGREVTVADVTATIKLLQATDFAGDPALADLWRGIAVQESVDEVRFTLPSPNAWFLEQASLGILPAHVLGETHGGALLELALNTRPVGSGPFKVVAGGRRQLTLAAHDAHYGPPPYIRGVDLRFYDNVDAALAALRRGEAAALRPHPAAELPAAMDGLIAYTRAERAKSSVLLFNTRSAPFDEPASRQAVASVLGGGTEELSRLRFAIVTNDRPEHLRSAEEAARSLGRAGASVEVHALGWTGMVADVLAPGRFQAALVEQLDPSPEPDPSPFWSSRGAFNFGRWSSPRGDELLAAARGATSRRERTQLLREWRALFAAEAPGLVVEQPRLSYFVSSELQGQSLGPLVTPLDRFSDIESWYLHTRRASPLAR